MFIRVYKVVKKIPQGKVATYGQVAKVLGEKDARKVGWALHKNSDPDNIPCHRVVNREGKLANNFAFGGWKAQKRKLLSEGVVFKSEKCVELSKHSWTM